VYNAVSDAESVPNVHSVADRRWRWFLWFACCGRERSVLLLSDRLNTWLLLVLAAVVRSRKVGVRLRNSKLLDWLEYSPWRARLAGFALRNMDLVVCVNEELRNAAESLGVEAQKLISAPGFLPPEPGASDPCLLPSDTVDFVESHRPIIAANGKVNWYKGMDLYGLDLLVDLVADLSADYPNIGLVVAFWDHSREDDSYLADLRDRARKLGVEKSVLFQTRSAKFLPVLSKADAFVRPTCTDGDANSVREALYLGVPCVASDCVGRPEGTTLFRSRSGEDLVRQVRLVLSQSASENVQPPGLTVDVDAYIEAIGSRLF
jgi:glycosyltransferase involved in cell wall biosynthesis